MMDMGERESGIDNTEDDPVRVAVTFAKTMKITTVTTTTITNTNMTVAAERVLQEVRDE
jgi:hypothetical protein